jgi:hypothetical protein
MEESQPEDEEGKARSLAEALVELERSFKKDDFARMQVLVLLVMEGFRCTPERPYYIF